MLHYVSFHHHDTSIYVFLYYMYVCISTLLLSSTELAIAIVFLFENYNFLKTVRVLLSGWMMTVNIFQWVDEA